MLARATSACAGSASSVIRRPPAAAPAPARSCCSRRACLAPGSCAHPGCATSSSSSLPWFGEIATGRESRGLARHEGRIGHRVPRDQLVDDVAVDRAPQLLGHRVLLRYQGFWLTERSVGLSYARARITSRRSRQNSDRQDLGHCDRLYYTIPESVSAALVTIDMQRADLDLPNKEHIQ